MNEKLRSLLYSWDWILALLTVLTVSYFIPGGTTFEMAKEIFQMGITVLAIVFSIFFAALAVLITAGDNQFVHFL